MNGQIAKLFNTIELISLNVVGASVTLWLSTFLTDWSTLIASLVGVSMIALNVVKLYGIHLDNCKKKKELKDGYN